MRRSRLVDTLALAAVLVLPAPANALFHIAVIDEMLSSYNGNANQQYIEIEMLFGFQNLVAHSVFAAFDADGNYIGDILEVPGNVPNGNAGGRWIVATSAFQTANGFTADFTMPASIPQGGGMVCFGGGGGVLPQNPPNWDRTNFQNYIDCLAYGTYDGPTNIFIGTPTSRAPVGHSLQRIAETNNNANDFTCAASLTPTNNAGSTLTLAPSIPCACGNGAADSGEQCDDGNQVGGDCCSPSCTPTSGSCDDGDACTLDDACSAGQCVGTPSGAPECSVNHFACYRVTRAKASRGQPPFPTFVPRTAVVIDQFSSSLPDDQHKLDLKLASSLCNPTDKDGEDPTAPSDTTHLEGYKARVSKTDPPQPKFQKVVRTVQNQLGTLDLSVNSVDRLLVPSNKVLGPSGAPPFTADDVDHFNCYRVTIPKGGAPFDPTTVELRDQFGGPLLFDVKKPTRLCAPASKNGGNPAAPAHPVHLVCYRATLTKTDPPQAKLVKTLISTNNQFGPEVLNATSLEELCIPSLLP